MSRPLDNFERFKRRGGEVGDIRPHGASKRYVTKSDRHEHKQQIHELMSDPEACQDFETENKDRKL